MDPFLQNIQHFLRRLSGGQKLALGFVVTGGVGLVASIAFWAGQPDYALLFGSLEPEDAGQVVEALQSEGVKYEIKNGGTAVFVPRDDVYELRLRFAGEGLVSDGPVGYELFDRGTLGMTDFMQKLNLKRALEGELARTITNVRQVEVARVHLVMPERSPFREAQVQPTASVVLKLRSSRLTAEQIDGITQLVAGAVEGLSPADVTVLDTRGNLLSDTSQGNADAIASSTQLEYQRAVEGHLTENGQTMLDKIVGPGNAVVRVSANIDFSRKVSESNIIDPESATVIAEESMDQTTGEDAANSSIRNFELSRTVERSESSTGQISYLTVSVILNDRRFVLTDTGLEEAEADADAADGEANVTYTEADLAEIESLVKNAVGFQPERGDRFAIHQTSFDTSVDQQIASDLRMQERDRQMQLYLRYGLMALALLAALWLPRSATRKVHIDGDDRVYLGSPLKASSLGQGDGGSARQLEAHQETDDADEVVLVDDFFTSKLSPDAKRRLHAKHLMYDEIKNTVNDNPADTADLLRNWMTEDAVPI